jgi:hypothetical protein
MLFGVLAGGSGALFRHGATLGGVGIVALWLQDRNGFPAGRTQLIFDGLRVPWRCPVRLANGAWSLLGAARRRDREPDRDGEPPARPFLLRGAMGDRAVADRYVRDPPA